MSQDVGEEELMGHAVVHFEMVAIDGSAAAKFYSELFGWHTEGFPMPDGRTYEMIDTREALERNTGL